MLHGTAQPPTAYSIGTIDSKATKATVSGRAFRASGKRLYHPERHDSRPLSHTIQPSGHCSCLLGFAGYRACRGGGHRHTGVSHRLLLEPRLSWRRHIVIADDWLHQSLRRNPHAAGVTRAGGVRSRVRGNGPDRAHRRGRDSDWSLIRAGKSNQFPVAGPIRSQGPAEFLFFGQANERPGGWNLRGLRSAPADRACRVARRRPDVCASLRWPRCRRGSLAE